MKTAYKNDDEKVSMHLISPEFMFGLAATLKFGADKYGERNWEHSGGLGWSRVYAAAQRHMWAWWYGEDSDPESGLSHIDHAAVCLMMLSTYSKRSNRFNLDDRPDQRAE